MVHATSGRIDKYPLLVKTLASALASSHFGWANQNLQRPSPPRWRQRVLSSCFGLHSPIRPLLFMFPSVAFLQPISSFSSLFLSLVSLHGSHTIGASGTP